MQVVVRGLNADYGLFATTTGVPPTGGSLPKTHFCEHLFACCPCERHILQAKEVGQMIV